MRTARLINGPFHGHTDTVIAAPEWVTVDPTCSCCNRPHLVALDADGPDERPAYRLEFADAASARYRYVLGPTDGEIEALLDYEAVEPHVDVDELVSQNG